MLFFHRTKQRKKNEMKEEKKKKTGYKLFSQKRSQTHHIHIAGMMT